MLITQLASVVANLSAMSDISQGSVATHMKCGEIFSNNVTTNFLLILTIKNFENWLIFNEFISVYKNCASFFWPTLYSLKLSIKNCSQTTADGDMVTILTACRKSPSPYPMVSLPTFYDLPFNQNTA